MKWQLLNRVKVINYCNEYFVIFRLTYFFTQIKKLQIWVLVPYKSELQMHINLSFLTQLHKSHLSYYINLVASGALA